MKRISIGFSVVLAVLILILAVGLIQAGNLQRPQRGPQSPLGTGFTYQGQLMKDDLPLNGDCDVAFRLYDAASGGDQVGSTITRTLTISNGLLTVNLDFGTGVFTGTARWLGLAVKCPGDAGFTTFGERQALTPAPYALYTSNADLLDGQHASDFVTQASADTRYAPMGYVEAGLGPQWVATIKRYATITNTSNFGVGDAPRDIAFDGVNMWIANTNDDNVSVLRVSDGYRIMTPTVGSHPYGIAFDGVNMWTANIWDNTVSVIRVNDGVLVATYPVGSSPYDLAFDGVNMWVANYGSATVSVLRASDGFHVMTPTVAVHPAWLAFDGVNIWVSNEGSNSVSVLRASDGYHVMTPTVTQPEGLAFDGANMWIVSHPGSVSVLRVSDGYRVMTPTVGVQAMGIAFDGASMWVASSGSDNISVLRASDGALIQTISIVDPCNITFDGVYMWITREPADIVSRR
ncbi:MAG TPA: YncE family protein [Anaerolineae bacterium]|nr:YncE family protein [Anaerolineae bacterium]